MKPTSAGNKFCVIFLTVVCQKLTVHSCCRIQNETRNIVDSLTAKTGINLRQHALITKDTLDKEQLTCNISNQVPLKFTAIYSRLHVYQCKCY